MRTSGTMSSYRESYTQVEPPSANRAELTSRPPILKSSSNRSSSKDGSPANQRAFAAGSANAPKTVAGIASNRRSMTIVSWLTVRLAYVVSGRVAVIDPLLRLHLTEERVQPVESALPELAIPLHPAGHVAQPLRVQMAGTPLRVPALDHETRLLEHLEVLGHPRQAHVEGPRELRHGRVTLGQPGEDRPSGRVC